MRIVDKGLQGFALGGIPEAVVDELGVTWNQAVAQVHEVAVHREGLHIAVRVQENRAGGGFVNPTTFHPDKSVFDDVDATHPVFASEGIEVTHHLRGIHGDPVDRDAVALFKIKLHVFRFVGGILRRGGQFIHPLVVFGGGIKPGIFQNTRLVGNMEEVAIH